MRFSRLLSSSSCFGLRTEGTASRRRKVLVFLVSKPGMEENVSALSKETVPSSKMLARNRYDAILYTAPTAFVYFRLLVTCAKLYQASNFCWCSFFQMVVQHNNIFLRNLRCSFFVTYSKVEFENGNQIVLVSSIYTFLKTHIREVYSFLKAVHTNLLQRLYLFNSKSFLILF